MKLQFIISFVLLKVVELLASRNISAKNPQFTMLNCIITVFFLVAYHAFQIIICGCWIFALALNSPMISVTTFDDESSDCKWDWPEQWMGAANETTWLVLLACIPLAIMTGLYSRVVYSLWFKRNDDQELAYRQKVRTRPT